MKSDSASCTSAGIPRELVAGQILELPHEQGSDAELRAELLACDPVCRSRQALGKVTLHARQEGLLPGRVALPFERLDPPPPHRGDQHRQVAGLTSLRERRVQLRLVLPQYLGTGARCQRGPDRGGCLRRAVGHRRLMVLCVMYISVAGATDDRRPHRLRRRQRCSHRRRRACALPSSRTWLMTARSREPEKTSAHRDVHIPMRRERRSLDRGRGRDGSSCIATGQHEQSLIRWSVLR